MRKIGRPALHNLTDDLVSRDHAVSQRRQFALRNVQVGAARAACEYAQPHLLRSRLGLRHVHDL
jgi:hypothetical protein